MNISARTLRAVRELGYKMQQYQRRFMLVVGEAVVELLNDYSHFVLRCGRSAPLICKRYFNFPAP